MCMLSIGDHFSKSIAASMEDSGLKMKITHKLKLHKTITLNFTENNIHSLYI